jgi:UDP-glucose 4-epimerase
MPAIQHSRVLVTGAGGFIGRHVVRRLLRRGCEVHGVSRRDPGSQGPGVRWWHGDVSDPQRVEEIVSAARPAIVVHLASHVSGLRTIDRVLPTFRDNLLSTVGVLIAASTAGCRRVVLAGSMEEPESTQAPATPASPYAAAKWAAGGYARMFQSLYGLSVAIVRIAMAYGPGQVDSTKLVPYVVRALLRGESPRLSSGSRAVDWIYVDDVADGIERACFAASMDGRTADLGSGVQVTVQNVVSQLVQIVDPSIDPAFGAIPDRPMEREPLADVAGTEAVLGWRPATPLAEGLRRTVQWYKENP